MQNFGQHGRELITSEVAVRLLALLASDAQLVKFCALQSIPAARLLASLKHVAMKVGMQAAAFSEDMLQEHFTQRWRVLLADILRDTSAAKELTLSVLMPGGADGECQGARASGGGGGVPAQEWARCGHQPQLGGALGPQGAGLRPRGGVPRGPPFQVRHALNQWSMVQLTPGIW